MGRSPSVQKEELERFTLLITPDTKNRLKAASLNPRHKGNMSQYALDALLKAIEQSERGENA